MEVKFFIVYFVFWLEPETLYKWLYIDFEEWVERPDDYWMNHGKTVKPHGLNIGLLAALFAAIVVVICE